MGINEFLSGDKLNVSKWDSVDAVAGSIAGYMDYNYPNRSIRMVGKNLNPTYNVSSNEYRVALRVTTYNVGRTFDYHLYVQTSTGQWAHKPGSLPCEILGYINPTTYDWTYHYNGQYAYYDSDVVYFAVGR